jgi:hypothetical protein
MMVPVAIASKTSSMLTLSSTISWWAWTVTRTDSDPARARSDSID